MWGTGHLIFVSVVVPGRTSAFSPIVRKRTKQTRASSPEPPYLSRISYAIKGVQQARNVRAVQRCLLFRRQKRPIVNN